MRLKCPRCQNKFEGQADPTDHVLCPSCGARLRVRTRPAVTADKSSALSAEASSMAPKTASKSPKDKDVTLDAGTVLGGFELKKLVGRGGMASVYKAIQLSLNRPVAVKVLAARFAKNPVFVQRFDREAGALANLNHPNIVNIIDKGVVGDNYYFVMELVEGITLDQLIHSVELNERHYTHIIGEISKALTYVHSKGIIHRDIKPSNVLVNKSGMVKVSDFGIAHITDAAMPQERFGKNATVGTANYMAPEQASNPASVDERADVYSLAVTFYKMFTKQLPLDKTKGPSVINPKLPRVMDPIVLRAMDSVPAKRYSTVQEFCNALIDCFSSAGKTEIVSSLANEAFMFNPGLAKPPHTGPDRDSSSSASSLFLPGTFPSLSDSSINHTPMANQVVNSEDEESGELEEDEDNSRQRMIFFAILAIIGIACLAIAGTVWYMYMNAY